MLIRDTHFPLLRRLQADRDQIIHFLCRVLFIWKEIKVKFENIKSILRQTVLQKMWALSICVSLRCTVYLLQRTKTSSQRIHKCQSRRPESSLPLKHIGLFLWAHRYTSCPPPPVLIGSLHEPNQHANPAKNDPALMSRSWERQGDSSLISSQAREMNCLLEQPN